MFRARSLALLTVLAAAVGLAGAGTAHAAVLLAPQTTTPSHVTWTDATGAQHYDVSVVVIDPHSHVCRFLARSSISTSRFRSRR